MQSLTINFDDEILGILELLEGIASARSETCLLPNLRQVDVRFANVTSRPRFNPCLLLPMKLHSLKFRFPDLNPQKPGGIHSIILEHCLKGEIVKFDFSWAGKLSDIRNPAWEDLIQWLSDCSTLREVKLGPRRGALLRVGPAHNAVARVDLTKAQAAFSNSGN